jgi:hypothetical protein
VPSKIRRGKNGSCQNAQTEGKCHGRPVHRTERVTSRALHQGDTNIAEPTCRRRHIHEWRTRKEKGDEEGGREGDESKRQGGEKDVQMDRKSMHLVPRLINS